MVLFVLYRRFFFKLAAVVGAPSVELVLASHNSLRFKWTFPKGYVDFNVLIFYPDASW